MAVGDFTSWRSHGWVEDANGCHIWQGYRDKAGRPCTTVGSGSRLVYRIRYLEEVGPIPTGLVLDHFACSNGAGGCCNPLHCRPVSHRENLLRGETLAAANKAKTTCPRGHALEGDNLLAHASKLGHRGCKECKNIARRTGKPRSDRPVKHGCQRPHRGRLKGELTSKTHCPRGHELSGDNLRQSDLERHGVRKCRICRNEREAIMRERKRALAAR